MRHDITVHMVDQIIMALSPQEVREISVRACVDPRTVRAVIAGKKVTSTCTIRVIRALQDAGRADLIPSLGNSGEK